MAVVAETSLHRLAQEASGGDAASLEALVEELQPMVVRVCRLIVGRGSWSAEDAAQDALIDITRNVHALRDPGAVRAWAHKLAVRRALKVARRERLKPVVLRTALPDFGTDNHREAFAPPSTGFLRG